MAKKRGKSPSALDRKPEDNDVVTWFMDAYSVLSRSRGENGRIPLNEMKAYLELFGSIVDNAEFVEIMQQIDDLYMKRAQK